MSPDRPRRRPSRKQAPWDPTEAELGAEWWRSLKACLRPRDPQVPLLTGRQVRDAAREIGAQLGGRVGLESPQVCRAVAALVTQTHPAVLAFLLASAPSAIFAPPASGSVPRRPALRRVT